VLFAALWDGGHGLSAGWHFSPSIPPSVLVFLVLPSLGRNRVRRRRRRRRRSANSMFFSFGKKRVWAGMLSEG